MKLAVFEGKFKALGLCVIAWDLAHHWFLKHPKNLIPLAEWDKEKELSLLEKYGLAERLESGIYVKGSKEHCEYLTARVEAGRRGGLKSQENFSSKRKQTKANRPSVSVSFSSSNNNNTNTNNEFSDENSGVSAGIKNNIPIQSDYDRLVQIWNQTVKNLPKVKNISKARIKKISARLAECKDFELWKSAIKMLDRSDWSNGKSERGWVADFDYLIRPEKFLGLIEKAQQVKQSKPKEKTAFEIPEGFLKS